MNYRFQRRSELGFDDTLQAVTKSLEREGFGIVSEVNVTDTLRKKLGVEFRPYKILGACNPKFALQAIETEPDIGVMMPCNVVVQDFGDRVEVAAMDPLAGMGVIGNADLTEFATAVSARLKRAIDGF